MEQINFPSELSKFLYVGIEPVDDDGNVVDQDGTVVEGITGWDQDGIVEGEPSNISQMILTPTEDWDLTNEEGVPVRYDFTEGLITKSWIKTETGWEYWENGLKMAEVTNYDWTFFPPPLKIPNPPVSFSDQLRRMLIKEKDTFVDFKISAPSLTKMDYYLERIPDPEVWFLQSERSGTNRYLHTYDINGNLLKTINLTTTLGTAADYRFYFMAADDGMNAVFMLCYIYDWRGYTGYSSFDGYWPVKIPLTVFNEEQIQKDYTANYGAYSPKYFCMGPGGLFFYLAEDIFANSDVNLFAKQDFGGSPFFEVTESTVSGGVYTPPDYEDWGIYTKSPCQYKDKFLLAVKITDTSVSPEVLQDCYIGVWDKESIGGNKYWYNEGMIGGFLSGATHLTTLTSDDFNRIYQILCYNDKVYVFSDGGSLTPKIGTRVRVYDFDGNLLENVEVHPWYYLEPVSMVRYQSGRVFCYRLMDVWGDFGSDYLSPVQFLDPDSLEVVHTLNLPIRNTLAVNRPVSNYMITKINDLRKLESGYPRPISGMPTYYQPVSYLGYNYTLETIAKNHLIWCAQNCRLTHEDVNGDLVGVRALQHGIWSAGENLGYIAESDPETEIDILMTGWEGSPGHKANLVNNFYHSMGYAWIKLPYTCTSLTLGSGLYSGGGYTTEETVITIPQNQRGKIKLYCQVFAGG